MDFCRLTVAEAAEKLKNEEITSLEITEACLARIEALDGQLKACLSVDFEGALKAAKAADERRKNGEHNPLLGIPYLAKDILTTKGLKTTAASKILENYIAPFDATVIKKLRDLGAVLLGKTNLDEFAHGASTENSAFGPSHNPWDLERVPGGSSGGSAAAVAADLCLFALGSDTGGSIRQPASFCNITGLKPTYGLVSRHGLLSMTSSTDVIGPMTKTVEDAAIILEAIAGADEYDSNSAGSQTKKYTSNLEGDLKGIKIGLPSECFTDDLDPEIKVLMDEVIKKLEAAGATFKTIDLPHTKYGIPVYYIITPSELSSNLARFDGLRFGLHADGDTLKDIYFNSRGQGFGPEAKRRIMLGTYALSAGYYDAYYKKAQAVRIIITKELEKALEDVDLIMTPTSPHPAFKIGAQSNDPLQMYLEDIFVTGASLAGLPAISIPAGFAHNLPVGWQLIGPRFGEDKILKIGYNYQRNTDWHNRRPELK